jgi:hypothetical protein
LIVFHPDPVAALEAKAQALRAEPEKVPAAMDD